MKVSEKIKENKIFFATFFLLSVTSVYILASKDIETLMDNYYYPLYVVDYSCGYSSRLLVGTIFSLFFKDKLDVLVLNKVLLVIYFVLCFFISLFVNNYLKNTNFQAVGIYSAFMVLSPVFLSLIRYFGITDTFWIFLTLGSLAVVNKKFLRWLLPVFCILALAVHEVFAVAYLPIIAMAVFYQFAKKTSASNFVYIAVCALTVGAAAFYFLFIGDGTMKMTSDEMVAFAENRLELHGLQISDYYLRSIFFWDVPEVEKYSGFSGYLKYNIEQFTLANPGSVRTILFLNISNFITAVPFFYLIFKAFKTEKNVLKKFVFACSFLLAPLTFALLLFSTDTERFSMHFILSILLFILFLIKEKDEAFEESYKNLTAKISKNKLLFGFVGLAAAKIVLSGVRF